MIHQVICYLLYTAFKFCYLLCICALLKLYMWKKTFFLNSNAHKHISSFAGRCLNLIPSWEYIFSMMTVVLTLRVYLVYWDFIFNKLTFFLIWRFISIKAINLFRNHINESLWYIHTVCAAYGNVVTCGVLSLNVIFESLSHAIYVEWPN